MPKKAETEIVVMDNGGTAEFTNPRQKSVIVVDKLTEKDGTASLTYTVMMRNGKVISGVVPEALYAKAMIRGMEAVLQDVMYGKSDIKDCQLATLQANQLLDEAVWPDPEYVTIGAKDGLLIQALTEETGKSEDQAIAWLRRNPGESLKECLARKEGLRRHGKIATRILELEAKNVCDADGSGALSAFASA